MDGRTYLENVIADRISQATAKSGPPQAIDRNEVRGIAMGLAAAGVLSEKDKDDLLATFDEALTDAGLIQVRRFEMAAVPPSRDERVQMALATSSVRRGVDSPRREGDGGTDTPQLLRVVPLHGRDFDTPEGRVILVSLEAWSQYVTLRIGYLNSRVSAADRMIGHRKWHGVDDMLTKYAESHSYWSDSHGCVLETRVFTPGPRSGATTLTLHADTLKGVSSLDIPLT